MHCGSGSPAPGGLTDLKFGQGHKPWRNTKARNQLPRDGKNGTGLPQQNGPVNDGGGYGGIGPHGGTHAFCRPYRFRSKDYSLGWRG